MDLPSKYGSRKLVKEPFQHQQLLRDIWGEAWGVSNEVGQIKKALMHRPGTEVEQLHSGASQIESGPVLLQSIKGQSRQDRGTEKKPSLERLVSQWEGVRQALQHEGIDVVEQKDSRQPWPEQLYTRDLGMVIPGGVILSRLALYIRYGEIRATAETLGHLGVPILGAVQGTGFAEGGSFAMLDDRTAVIGRSERVNPAGIEQIRHILAIQHIELLVVDLPASIIHLDEAFMMVDYHKALVNTALLPYWFLDELKCRGIEMLHVDPQDPPLTINALAVAPGRVIMADSGKRTIDLLDRHGVSVIAVEADEIFKLGGGIHCMILPLIRE
ncbi:amidinotransferase [Xylanibacillus composti]|uniref:Nitrate reductase n=1 Tax=Xylanibacillus composti TaxID=1572762 RepID=A0A8J4H0M4_9BACL|nr:arginine deiminase family protein [Xylanibacillus composti]MDT9726124.1 amidinotransferase [Xylanibacillus composti]GIQ68728.1 nitrate reductase [Xylanibacillus composti]